jgi:hypothetical protein
LTLVAGTPVLAFDIGAVVREPQIEDTELMFAVTGPSPQSVEHVHAHLELCHDGKPTSRVTVPRNDRDTSDLSAGARQGLAGIEHPLALVVLDDDVEARSLGGEVRFDEDVNHDFGRGTLTATDLPRRENRDPSADVSPRRSWSGAPPGQGPYGHGKTAVKTSAASLVSLSTMFEANES